MYFIILLSISICQNFLYEDVDWYSISNPGSIKSITSAYDQIIFCSDNGIFTFDISNSSLIYDQEYITNFNSSSPLLIHYDEYTDYMWFLNDEGLYYKPRISTFWRELSDYKLNLSSFNSIKNIGSNYEYIFLDLGYSILTLDSITGNLVADDNYDYRSIKWSSSLENNSINSENLSNYFSFKGYNIVSDNKIEFGRYLAYQSNNFNIQVDVFSSNYMGQIHNHGTWGMLGIVHGDFIIRDYITNYDKLSQVNTTIGSKGLVTYFPKAYDVHAVESLSGPQGITIHVYGKEFNMDTGMKFENANNNWQSYKRGKLREFIEIEFNFRIKGT